MYRNIKFNYERPSIALIINVMSSLNYGRNIEYFEKTKNVFEIVYTMRELILWWRRSRSYLCFT